MAAILPFVAPALSAAQGLTTALGMGLALSPAIDFARNYAGRLKGSSRMSMFGGTDFTNLPGGANYKEGNRPGDIDFRKIGEDPLAPIEEITQNTPAGATQRFDNTLAGQYQRYFKTPEFDGVFGAGARGTGSPQDAAAMEVFGNRLRRLRKIPTLPRCMQLRVQWGVLIRMRFRRCMKAIKRCRHGRKQTRCLHSVSI